MFLTKAAYARHRKVSGPRITELIKAGRIVLTEDGKVDVAASDALLAATTQPIRAAIGQNVPALATEGGTVTPQRLMEARYRMDTARADLLEVQASAEKGEYISVAEMRAEVFKLSRMVRDGFQNLPDRLAALIAAENDAARVHQILTYEIRTVLEGLSKPENDDYADSEALQGNV